MSWIEHKKKENNVTNQINANISLNDWIRLNQKNKMGKILSVSAKMLCVHSKSQTICDYTWN